MTRDSIPRDDLYGELEVSRQASVAAIEAAYRRLVKQHHPDVARSDDVERIKRLNLAREWLTDLDRRRRYDVSRGMSPTSAIAHHSSTGDDAAPGSRRRTGQRTARSVPDASSEPARSFGVNANEVRIFLASLRGLDSERARRVFDGRAVAHAKGYTAARRAAAQVGQSKRKTEWQLAREAASVIARGKLGDTTLTEQIVDVLADIAGAIAIRDLLTKSDYKALLLPWTWKSARVVPTKAAATRAQATQATAASASASAAKRDVPPSLGSAPVRPAVPVASAGAPPVAAAPHVAVAAAAARTEQATRPVSIADLGTSPWQRQPSPAPPRRSGAARTLPLPVSIPAVSVPSVSLRALNPPRVRVPSWLPAAFAIAVFFVVVGALLGIGRPPSEQAVAGITDAPTSQTDGAATAVLLPPGESITGATGEPGASGPGGETPAPGVTEPAGAGGGPTSAPNPTNAGPTPRPTQAPTAPPTPAPTPPPTTEPTPPPPTPTPGPDCLVPTFIDTQASNAEQKWANAGFTGPLTLDPPIPPNYQIQWQSIPAGTMSPCTSGITLRVAAP